MATVTEQPPAGAASASGPIRKKQFRPADFMFASVLVAALAFSMAALFTLIWDVVGTGLGVVSWDFVTSMDSRRPSQAGIYAALLGSLWLVGLVAVIAFPLGVGAAIHLEEFAPKNRLTRIIEVNIANLAAVPSVVYGMLGLAAFVRFAELGRSILAAALTLSLLVLPIIIVASREALRAVPSSIRAGGLALGATKWETVRSMVLPAALPGILTGTILALSRAIGEAAPLLLVGAAGFVTFAPNSPMDNFTVLPVQIFKWTGLPAGRGEITFAEAAAGGIICMMIVLLLMNGTAIFLRNKYSRKW